MKIELTDEEREMLIEILPGVLTTMEVEMHRTDELTFKGILKRRCKVLEGLLAKVNQVETGAAR